jgi:transposase
MLMLMSPETRVPATHPLRAIKRLADAALSKLSPVFDEMYSSVGRPSIPPERLLKSMVLIALYTVRSERQFCEQLDYNLLFRWFLDMDMAEPSFDATVFTKNRDRLVASDAAGEFFRSVVEQARSAGLMSGEHFSVDGTLIEA